MTNPGLRRVIGRVPALPQGEDQEDAVSVAEEAMAVRVSAWPDALSVTAATRSSIMVARSSMLVWSARAGNIHRISLCLVVTPMTGHTWSVLSVLGCTPSTSSSGYVAPSSPQWRSSLGFAVMIRRSVTATDEGTGGGLWGQRLHLAGFECIPGRVEQLAECSGWQFPRKVVCAGLARKCNAVELFAILQEPPKHT